MKQTCTHLIRGITVFSTPKPKVGIMGNIEKDGSKLFKQVESSLQLSFAKKSEVLTSKGSVLKKQLEDLLKACYTLSMEAHFRVV